MDTRHLLVDDIFGIDNIRNCEEYVLSIQRRLDKAVADDDTKGIRETFDLLAKRSMAVKILAIKRITSDNKGKYTAGVDGIAMPKDDRQLQNQMRLKLLDKIDIMKKPNEIKRIYIPKPNGKKRPLGIPTLIDRIIQDILRTALEPIVEYHFSKNSYGFRPKKSCQDAQAHLFKKLGRTTSPKYVVEGDIKGCFDNINHEHIINTLLEWQVPIWATEVIMKMLKSDIFHNGEVYDNDTGTPQGGVISPLLANVALTTLDNFCEERYGNKQWKNKNTGFYVVNPIIRYADDFIIVSKSELEAKEIKREIAKHLSDKVGLTLSVEKTKITHIKHGFNFLGFNFRKYKPKGKTRTPIKKSKKSDYVMLIAPEKDKVKNLLRSIKDVLDKNKSATQKAIIHILNPKLRGWGMYYRFVSSKKAFAKIDHEVWLKTFWWAKRRHPNKSKGWVIRKYFSGKVKNRKAVFKDTISNYDIFTLAYIPIKRHVLVNGNMRVYDQNPHTIEYWRKREYTNAFKQIESVRIEKLYKRQNGICDYCNKPITTTDIKEREIHIHHMKPRSFGGNESYSNLKLLHSECHRELHVKLSRKYMSDLVDKKVKYLMSENIVNVLESRVR
ncbi:MAG: group II intron reverse transcriptase/maturase [Candidatus Poribacteria bacterium]|nr:group II intron reverse transcriptase/maturase [Candidatus Poribacteria bacterium]